MNESEFYVNNRKQETKEYKYYFDDGTSSESTSESESQKQKACAYTMYSSNTKATKFFVRQSKGFLFDPNEINIKSKENFVFKSTNSISFNLYVDYLNPKKRSRFRLIAAQKNL